MIKLDREKKLKAAICGDSNRQLFKFLFPHANYSVWGETKKELLMDRFFRSEKKATFFIGKARKMRIVDFACLSFIWKIESQSGAEGKGGTLRPL